MKATLLAQRYCSTLGLSSDASAEEIREAYYRLAFTHHPDRNPGDAFAAARFKEIQVAYEWLTQRRVAPPPTAEQFPFVAPKRSEAGLVWQRLAALAAVAALAITLTLLLRTAPRMGADIKTKSPRLEQLPDPSRIATQIPQSVKIPNEEFTAARRFLTAISPPDRSPPDNSPPDNDLVERSAAGRSEWLAERSVRSLLESVEWSPPVTFASALDAARDAVCRGVFSAESLTEDWHSGPSWQVSMRHGLTIVPKSITGTAFVGPTPSTPNENDQHVLIESGLFRFGNRRREPVSLDSEIASSALQSAAWQLEPGNDIPGKRNRDPQSRRHQQSQPIEPAMPHSFESVNRGDAQQQPKRDSHSHILEVLRSTTIPTNRGHSNPALFNPLERFSSAVSKDARKPSELFPGQPKGSPGRQEEKLLGHWPLHETPHKRPSTDRANSIATTEVSTWGSTATAEVSTWEANLLKAWPQSGVASGNVWGRVNSFEPANIRGVEGDFSVGRKGGAMANLGWNTQKAPVTSSNYTGLTTRSEERSDKSFLSPTASQIDHPIQTLDQPSVDQPRWGLLAP